MKKEIIASDLNPLVLGLVGILSVIQLAIKGFALWRASQLKQRNWFVALFILIPLNDLGIIELFYLFWFAKKRVTITEINSWVRSRTILKKLKK